LDSRLEESAKSVRMKGDDKTNLGDDQRKVIQQLAEAAARKRVKAEEDDKDKFE
jgi:hypothetical protein